MSIFGILIFLLGLLVVIFARQLSNISFYRYKKPGFYIGPYKIGKKVEHAQTMNEAFGEKKAIIFMRVMGILIIIISFLVLTGILKIN